MENEINKDKRSVQEIIESIAESYKQKGDQILYEQIKRNVKPVARPSMACYSSSK